MSQPERVIVIGASAGGIEALIDLVETLPPNLPAALFVVVHFPPDSRSFLPEILNRYRGLTATHAEDGEAIEAGRIYVAPPDQHLLLDPGRVRLARGPRENGFRPAVDPLFRTAARAYGSRAVGVVLSGTLGDGLRGAYTLKSLGGIVLVQDPAEAVFASMPVNVIENVLVDAVLPAAQIGTRIVRLAHEPVEERSGAAMSDVPERESEVVQNDMQRYEQGQYPNATSVLTCPECGGVLWELRDGQLVAFRCHVGHAYSPESFLSEQTEALEMALWTAVRTLEERATLVRRLAGMALERGSSYLGGRYATQADEAERNADLIRKMLLDGRSSFLNGAGGDSHGDGTPG